MPGRSSKSNKKQIVPSVPAVLATYAPQAKGALTVIETCQYLSVSRNTLYRLGAAGELRPIRVLAKPMYRVVDLNDFLAARATEAEAV